MINNVVCNIHFSVMSKYIYFIELTIQSSPYAPVTPGSWPFSNHWRQWLISNWSPTTSTMPVFFHLQPLTDQAPTICQPVTNQAEHWPRNRNNFDQFWPAPTCCPIATQLPLNLRSIATQLPNSCNYSPIVSFKVGKIAKIFNFLTIFLEIAIFLTLRLTIGD